MEKKEEFEEIDISDLPEYLMIWFKNIKLFEKEKVKVYEKLRSCTEQDQLFQIEMNTKTNKYFIEINISKNHLDCISLKKEPVPSVPLHLRYDNCFFLRDELNTSGFHNIMAAIVFHEAEQINHKTFKLSEIIDFLKKGHIVTREKWNFKQYIYYNREKLPQIVNEMGSECYWIPNIEDLEADDWIDSGFSYTGPESLMNIFGRYHDYRQI